MKASWLAVSTSSSKITISRLRAPSMKITWLPVSLRAMAVGSAMAVPTLPATMAAVPYFLISEGWPSGPTTSRIASPASRQLSNDVVLPTACTTMVMVPAAGSALLMVSGMRSPFSLMRRMTNWPGRCLRAMRGAAMTSCRMLRPASRASTILNTVRVVLRGVRLGRLCRHGHSAGGRFQGHAGGHARSQLIIQKLPAIGL